jgi:hypothetical protein
MALTMRQGSFLVALANVATLCVLQKWDVSLHWAVATTGLFTLTVSWILCVEQFDCGDG